MEPLSFRGHPTKAYTTTSVFSPWGLERGPLIENVSCPEKVITRLQCATEFGKRRGSHLLPRSQFCHLARLCRLLEFLIQARWPSSSEQKIYTTFPLVLCDHSPEVVHSPSCESPSNEVHVWGTVPCRIIVFHNSPPTIL